MPSKYGDFSKCVSDILSDDYGTKKVVKSKFSTEPVYGGAINFTMENTYKPVDKTALFGKLSAKWKHKSSGFNVDKLALNTNGSVNGEMSISKLPLPGATLKFAGTSAKTGDVTCEFKNNFNYTIVKVNNKMNTTLSSVAASNGGTIGGQLAVEDGKLKSYEFAVGYGTSAYFASMRSFEKMAKLALAGMYKIPAQPVTMAAELALDVSSDAKMGDASLGMIYKLNDKASIKAKYVSSKDSTVEAAASYNCLSKVDLLLSLALPIQSPTDKYKTGCSLTLG